MKSICYTGKQPLLIFTGTSSGELTKWESQPHSKYIYLSDNYRQDSTVISTAISAFVSSDIWTYAEPIFSLQEGLAINGFKNKTQAGGDFTNLKKHQIAFMDIKYHEGLFARHFRTKDIFTCLIAK